MSSVIKKIKEEMDASQREERNQDLISKRHLSLAGSHPIEAAQLEPRGSALVAAAESARFFFFLQRGGALTG